MDDKFTTLATLTYSKALILKSVLESEGIETHLHNASQLRPIVTSDVRVQVRESDMSSALEVMHRSDWLSEDANSSAPLAADIVLIPVDFSPCSLRACEAGFDLAALTNSEVVLLHVCFTPIYANPLQYGDFFRLTASGHEADIKATMSQVNADLKKFSDSIASKIQSGELPDVKYHCVLRDGIPEEEILRYSHKVQPRLIVMGTRGSGGEDMESMGSVTAEIIERTDIPVLAIPVNAHPHDFSAGGHMALLTSFDQRDLMAFDALINNFRPVNYSIDFLHLTHDPANAWNEVKLAGIKEYFSRQYPGLNINCNILPNDQLLQGLDSYIREHNIDIVATTSYKRNIFARLINPGMASKVLFHNNIPLLVLTPQYRKE